jgi:hybrid cluster-associated redox disulfide protein
MAKKEVINKDMTFGTVLEKHPECAEIMMEKGMHCCGCGAAFYETIAEGAIAHGMSEKDVDNMVKEMNKKISKK